MRPLHFIIAAVLLSSCNNSSKSDSKTNQSPSSAQTDNTAPWKDYFVALRLAIIKEDRATVKSFFDFPIESEGNEIWYLGDPENVMTISSDKIKPFTSSDFDKYYNTVISLELRKTLEQFDAAEFIKNHAGTSKDVVLVKDSKCKLEAKYDEKNRVLTLAVLTEGEGFEFAVFYDFEMKNDGNLKFKQVHVAG